MVQLCTAPASCPVPGSRGSHGGSCFLHTGGTAVPSAVSCCCLHPAHGTPWDILCHHSQRHHHSQKDQDETG